MPFLRLKYRLSIALLLLTLLPAIPLSLVFSNLIDRLFAIAINPSIDLALENALMISRSLLDQDKLRTAANLRRLSEHDMFRGVLVAALSGEQQNSRRQYPVDVRSLGLTQALLFDDEGRLIARFGDSAPPSPDPALMSALRTAQTTDARYDERNHLMVAAQLVPVARQRAFFLVAWSPVSEELVRRSSQVLHTLQSYRSLDLQRTALTRSFFYSFLIIEAFILILAALLAYLFASILSKPIQTLAWATRQVAQGNLDYRIPSMSRKDEIGQLVASFNQMTQNLKNHQERLLFLEKMATWREIAQRLAHEIKNPLTPIQLTIQQLRDAYAAHDAQFSKLLSDSCEIIDEEVQSLKKLTSEFSAFARLPALSFRTHNVNDLIREVAALYAGAPLELHLEESMPAADVDAEALKRVLINLVENAVAAVSAVSEREIRITTTGEGDTIAIRVTDNGHGIPRSQLSQIFEPHFSTKTAGMGLGLAIARNIVEEHRGSILVESVEHRGTTLLIRLPVSQKSIS